MSKFQIQNFIKISLLSLVITTQSCKTSENTNPTNTCRLSKYVVNTYTNSPDYVREIKYDNDGNLIIHKINDIYPSSQPSSIVGIRGEKDSIIYRNKEIYKLYHFNNRFLRWDLETEKEYFYVDGKILRIITKNIKIDTEIQYQNIRSVIFDKFSYDTNGKLKTKISFQKLLIYQSGTPPNIKTTPLDSAIISRDTTFYTFENNNLVKKENHFFEINFGIISEYPAITQIEYLGYDAKINPFYKLPIENNNFVNLSENNFSKKNEIITYKYGFYPDLQTYKSESGFTQSFTYDSKGYPIDINNSNKLSVFVKKDLPYYLYECK